MWAHLSQVPEPYRTLRISAFAWDHISVVRLLLRRHIADKHISFFAVGPVDLDNVVDIRLLLSLVPVMSAVKAAALKQEIFR